MKKLTLILIVSIFGIFVVNGCKRLEENDLRFVEYLRARPEKADNKKEFFGYIKAGGEVEIGFETFGTIQKIFFTDGDSVKKGQVIAILDNELNQIEEKEMEAALRDAYVKYQHSKNYFERIDKLHAVGGISDNDWDKARMDMESNSEQIEISKDRLQYSRKKAGFGKIIAPRDGILLKKLVEEGTYVNSGQGVVVFQDDRDSEAKIFVSEKYINRLKNGMEALIKADGITKEPLKARIKSITKTSINEGAYRVTVKFDEKYPELKDGVGIRAVIKFDDKEDNEVILVPITSVLEDEISSYVWILEILKENNGQTIAKTKKQNVTVVETSGERAIVEGIRRNDLVVTKGAEEIMEGQKVKIKPEKEFQGKGGI